jgi:hypothetical protein
MFGSRAGSMGPGVSVLGVFRRLAALLLSVGLPAGALAATTPVAIDLGTSVQALPIILSGQPGCNLPPPPSLFGPGPETYSHGQASVTTGPTGNHVLEIVGLATPPGAPADPVILLYQGAFNPADPATNLVACDDNGAVDLSLPPTFSRLVVNPATPYTVVVLVPEDAGFAPGTSTATLSSALEPAIAFADKSIALGAVGESMTATSDSAGTISYAIQNPFVALIDPATGVLTPAGTGTTLVAALQARDGGAYGSGFKEATLTVTAATPAPTVTAITPASGPVAGGTAVTISGTDFTGATAVTIGGVAATGYAVASSTTITATTPPGTAGSKDVAVTTPAGTGTGVGLYTYVAPPAAAKLAFTTQPAGALAATAFATQPVAAIQDAGGATLTTATDTVTLAIKAGTGTAGAALACTPTAAVAGLASFAGCRIDRPGIGYVLTAGSGALTAADSSAFAVCDAAGTAAASGNACTCKAGYTGPTCGVGLLTFVTQPTTSARTTNAITVSFRVSGTGDTAYAVAQVAGAAAPTVAQVVGTAASGAIVARSGPAATTGADQTLTLTGLAPNTTYDIYVALEASSVLSTKLVQATARVATKLAFATQPAGAVAGVAFTTQPKVAIQDASGIQTADTDSIVLMIKPGTGASGAALTCAPTAAVAGLATFAGCTIDKPGMGYILTAGASGLVTAESTAFDVAAPPPAPITGVNISLSSTTANATGVTVTVSFTMPAALPAAGKIRVTLPGFAWPATPSASFTAPAGTAAPASAAYASNVLTVTAAAAPVPAGTVTLRVTGATNPAAGTIAKASLMVLTLDSAGAVVADPGASANDIVITAATAASKLAFTAQPDAAVAGTPFATQPVVAIRDASGNLVTTSTATVTLAKKAGTGTLACNANAVAAVAGVATFSGCRVDSAGSGFVLAATATGLTSADSAPFAVAMPAPTVTSINPPSGPTTGGTSVTILGSFFTGATAVTIGGAPATNVTVVSATQITATTPAGTAGAKDVAVTTSGGTGTGAGLYTYTGASRLAFVMQPARATVGRAFATQPSVAIRDASGVTLTTSTATVTLAATGLTCDANSVAAVAGIATFSGCRISRAGTFRLSASATGLLSAESPAFLVSPPAQGSLKLAMGPVASQLPAGKRFDVTISAEDSAGNPAVELGGSVTLSAFSTATSSGLDGVLTAPFVEGVATFSDLRFTARGTYRVTASNAGLTSVTSPSITVTPSTTVSGLRFSTQPVAEVSGVAFTDQPVVRAELEDGSVATSFTGTVGLVLGKTGGATASTLAGTTTAQFVNGIASFPGIRVDGTDTNLYLAATAGTLTATSGAFNVYGDAAAATLARAKEQVTAKQFTLTFNVAQTPSGSSASIKSDICRALALDAAGCARILVATVSSSSSASLMGGGSATGKAGTVPPGAALKVCGEVDLDANGEAILPACPVAGPGTYVYALSVPGQPLMASRPYIVVDSLEGALPGAPGNLRVEPGDGVAVVSWDPPAAKGAGPIIAYDVYGLQDGAPERLLASDALTSKTLKLANGSVWRFGVRAVNDLGQGAMAQGAPVVIGVAPASPGKPRLSRVQGPSGDEVEVAWDIPPGNPTEFEAVSSGGQSCRRGNFGSGFASASCRVAVESGKTVTFRVIARNAVGQSMSPESDALAIPPERIDGKCGAKALQASLVMPMADLCEAGGASGAILSAQGAWQWQCGGVNGGGAASCSSTPGAPAVGFRTFATVPVSAASMPKVAGGGCRLQRAETVAVGTADGPGSGAVMPYGAVGLELADCEGGKADVTIRYPVAIEDMAFHARVDGQWFLTPPPGTGLLVKGDTVTLAIIDNGPWDADPQAGIISFVGGVGYREEWLPDAAISRAGAAAKQGIRGAR